MKTAATPEWPCPYCGHDALYAIAGYGKGPTEPVVCGHCNVLFTPHWVDGCWTGRMVEAEWPGALS